MYILVSISTPMTMLDTYSKIIAMSFQGNDFTPAMKQLVINLKLHFDEERKHYHKTYNVIPSSPCFLKTEACFEILQQRVDLLYHVRGGEPLTVT